MGEKTKCTKVEGNFRQLKDGLYKNSSTFTDKICYNNSVQRNENFLAKGDPYEQYFIFYDTEGIVSSLI